MSSAAQEDQWHESVLSTRSLSFVSQADALEASRTSGHQTTFSAPTRKSTLTSIPDMTDSDILDMHRAQQVAATTQAQDHSASLPVSVSQSPIFKLSRELREIIYLHILHSTLGFNFPADHVDRHVDPSILRTCKAIYSETAALLYSVNKVIFSHPSDANMFRHALASPDHAFKFTSLILRIKSGDTRLWTAYFNSLADERSLVKDYPGLQTLYVRFRGPKFLPFFGHEQNAMHWLRDPKLQEVIVSVRKCVPDVRLDFCVQVPPDWTSAVWEKAVVRTLAEQDGYTGGALPMDGGYWRVSGVWLRLETEGT